MVLTKRVVGGPTLPLMRLGSHPDTVKCDVEAVDCLGRPHNSGGALLFLIGLVSRAKVHTQSRDSFGLRVEEFWGGPGPGIRAAVSLLILGKKHYAISLLLLPFSSKLRSDFLRSPRVSHSVPRPCFPLRPAVGASSPRESSPRPAQPREPRHEHAGLYPPW